MLLALAEDPQHCTSLSVFRCPSQEVSGQGHECVLANVGLATSGPPGNEASTVRSAQGGEWAALCSFLFHFHVVFCSLFIHSPVN